MSNVSNNYFLNKKFRYFAIIVTIVLFPAFSSAQMLHPDKPDTAKKCAICHFQWVYPFYTEHRDGELAAQPKKRVAGAQEICFSCHDGSVADSRDSVFHGPGHQAGVIPSVNVKIPEDFPLDEEGKMQCSTCHTPHALSSVSGAEIGIEIFFRASNKESNLCRICHVDKADGPGHGNHSINISAHKIPREILKSGGRFGETIPNQIICETCHIAHGGVNSKFLVLSVEDPRTRSVLCEACHTKKPGLAKDPSLNRFSHPLDLVPGKPTKIPKKWRSGDKVVLGTGGELVCRTCHIPHGAVEKRALLTESTYICTHCHPQHGLIEGTDHDLSMVAPEFKNTSGQTPEQGGVCSPCHVVHRATQQRHLWSGPIGPAILKGWEQDYKVDNDMMTMLCTGCHSPGNIAETQIPQFGLHPKGFLIPEEETVEGRPRITFEMVKDEFPIFTNTGEIAESGNIICSTCHNPHQWDPHVEEKGPGKEVEGNVTNSFLRPNLHSKFCTECHGKDGLIKLKYFHSHIGRQKKEAPFSFE